MIALYFFYWPASALAGAVLNPTVDFIYQNYYRSGNVYFIFEASNALVIGTLWNYFLVKTFHWIIVCGRTPARDCGEDELEDTE